MTKENNLCIGKKIFKKYEQLIRCPNSVPKEEYEYMKEIVHICSESSFDRPIEKETMYKFLEMADRYDMRISIKPYRESYSRVDGWEYYLEQVET